MQLLTKHFRARLHETRNELKPVWNLKTLWNVVLFTWQFTWRFHCGNFSSNGKALLQMCKWYLLINANLFNLMQTQLIQNRCCAIDCFLNNSSKAHAHYLATLNDSAQLYLTAGIYCLYGKLTAVWNFFGQFDRSEICTEVSFTPPEVMWMLIMKLLHTEVKFYPEVKSQTVLSSLRVSCKRALKQLYERVYITTIC